MTRSDLARGLPMIALDVHAHLVPIEQGSLNAIPGVEWASGEGVLVVDGHRVGFKALFDPDALIGWMDENGVETAWVSIPPLAYRQHLSAEEAARWFAYVNDGLDAISSQYPGRLEPLYHLPIEHPDLARDIAAAKALAGQARFAMAAGGKPGLMMSDAACEPLWAVLDSAEAFVFVHPAESCDPRLQPFYLHNLVGNPSETAVAVFHMLLSGVLDRHPRMRVCLAHGGGTTAAVAGRVLRGQATGRPGVEKGLDLKRLLRRLCVDCITHDHEVLRLAERIHGRDNILFGSDWPFPMGVMSVSEQLAGLDKGLLDAMFEANPRRLMQSVQGHEAKAASGR